MKNCGIKTKQMSKPETLELGKIICDTSYLGWLINYSQISNMIAKNYGVNYDDTRPGPVLDLHFTYPINEKLTIKSFNYIINYNDATSGDETVNTHFNQKLGLVYRLGGTIFFPYGKMEHHDENPKKQIDNSHLGLVVEQYFSKDYLYLLIIEKNFLMVLLPEAV